MSKDETQAELLKLIYYAAHNVSKELKDCMPEIEMHEARDFPFAGLRSELQDLNRLLKRYEEKGV